MVNPFFLIIHQFSTLFIPSSEKLREIWSRDNIKGSDFHQPASINLYDLKTIALNLVVEELGLTEPDRYVWTLRSRATFGT